MEHVFVETLQSSVVSERQLPSATSAIQAMVFASCRPAIQAMVFASCRLSLGQSAHRIVGVVETPLAIRTLYKENKFYCWKAIRAFESHPSFHCLITTFEKPSELLSCAADSATGTDLKWYLASTSGSPLALVRTF